MGHLQIVRSLSSRGKFRLVNSFREHKRVPGEIVYIRFLQECYPLRIAISIRHPWRIEIYIYTYIRTYYDWQKWRRSKTRFPRWENIFPRHLSVVWETRIRICMRKGMASEEDCHGGFPLGFCFHRRGERNIGIESSSPFRALLAKSVVGPIYDDKGDGGGRVRGGKKKKKKKGRTRATKGRRKVRRTETNGRRVEARGRGTRCEVNTGCPVNFIPKDWPRDALRFMECILVKIHSEMKGVLHITWKIARFLVKRMNSIVTWTTPPPPPPPLLPPFFSRH